MPKVTVFVFDSELETAERIAKKMRMFLGNADIPARYILSTALEIGMRKMRHIWNEQETVTVRANAREAAEFDRQS